MKRSIFKQTLLSRAVALEDHTPNQGDPVAVPLQSDETVEPVESPGIGAATITGDDILVNLQDQLHDVGVDVKALEALVAVANTTSLNCVSNESLQLAVTKKLRRGLANPDNADRMLAASLPGGITSTNDVIALEDISANAARSFWRTIGDKVTKILGSSKEVENETAERGKAIVDGFKEVKEAALGFRGETTLNLGAVIGDADNIQQVIENTNRGLSNDISLRTVRPIDIMIENASESIASAIKSGDHNKVTAAVDKAKASAKSIADQSAIDKDELVIMGFIRNKGDDAVSICLANRLGSTDKVNYPKYKAAKGGKQEFTLNKTTIRQLYDLGIMIGREIQEQARVWDNRLTVLNKVKEISRDQSKNVDEDKNTWEEEQRISTAIVRMVTDNIAFRQHCIDTYCKVAELILGILREVTGTVSEATAESYLSMEFLGKIFGKKSKTPQESPEEKLKLVTEHIATYKTPEGIAHQGLRVYKDVTAQNFYDLLLRDLEAFLKTFTPAANKTMFDQVGRIIKQCDIDLNDEDADIEGGFEDIVSDSPNLFRPTAIYHMVGNGRTGAATTYKTLINLSYYANNIGLDFDIGNVKLPVPYPTPEQAVKLSKLLPSLAAIDTQPRPTFDVNHIVDDFVSEAFTVPLSSVMGYVGEDIYRFLLDALRKGINTSSPSTELFGLGKKRTDKSSKPEPEPELSLDEKLELIEAHIDSYRQLDGGVAKRVKVGPGVTTENYYSHLIRDLTAYNKTFTDPAFQMLLKQIGNVANNTKLPSDKTDANYWYEIEKAFMATVSARPQMLRPDVIYKMKPIGNGNFTTGYLTLTNLEYVGKTHTLEYSRGDYQIDVLYPTPQEAKALGKLVIAVMRDSTTQHYWSDAHINKEFDDFVAEGYINALNNTCEDILEEPGWLIVNVLTAAIRAGMSSAS